MNRRPLLRACISLVVLLLVARVSWAQAQVSDIQPLSPEQQSMVNAGLGAIGILGGALPPPGSEILSATIGGGPAAASDPGPPPKIYIDFSKVERKLAEGNGGVPPPGAPGYGGVVALLISHEAEHLNDPQGHGGDPCGELTTTAEVAEVAAEFI